jgi:hypothetical protein
MNACEGLLELMEAPPQPEASAARDGQIGSILVPLHCGKGKAFLWSSNPFTAV